MRKKEIISHWQLLSIITGYLLGTAIIFCFSIVYAKRDAWIAELTALSVGLIIFFMISYIVNQFPEKDVDEILESMFSPLGAKLIMISFLVFSVLISVFILNEIQGFMVVMVMQETPPWVFTITGVLTFGIIIRHGIEVFARCSEICLPIILIFVGILVFLATLFIDWDNLLPLFTEDFTSLLKATIVSANLPYLEVALFFFIGACGRVTISYKTDICYWCFWTSSFGIGLSYIQHNSSNYSG